MSKIPTIEEVLKSNMLKQNHSTYNLDSIYASMKEYAELVKAETLKVVAEEASCEDIGGVNSNGESYEEYQVNKQSILDLITHKDLEIL
jgi:hypothetical protein